MPRLEISDPGCNCAADVRAKAFLVFEKRRLAYLKLSAEPPPAEPEQLAEPERSAKVERSAGNWRPIWAEISRQTGVPAEYIKKGGEAHGQPIIAYRQLGISLTLRLTKLGLSGVGRLYGVDHSTCHHARAQLRPILDACGCTEADPVPVWVAACLPLLFVSIGEHRRQNRDHAQALPSINGKFAAAPLEREPSSELPSQRQICG
jgi:hypothetical protein